MGDKLIVQSDIPQLVKSGFLGVFGSGNGAETETTNALSACGYTTADTYAGTDVCQTFDGVDTWSSIATATACSATAGGRDNIICGSVASNDYTNYTQKLVSGSWSSLQNYPIEVGAQMSDGLYSNDDIIVAGGVDESTGASTDRTSELSSDSWASGGALNTDRYAVGGSGTKASAIIVGGNQSGAGGYQDSCELYNGSTWDENHNINSARTGGATCGSDPSVTALTVGGYSSSAGAFVTDVELFDGDAWANGTFLLVARAFSGLAGTPEECVVSHGATGNWNITNNSLTYNGTSWTSSGNLSNYATECAGH